VGNKLLCNVYYDKKVYSIDLDTHALAVYLDLSHLEGGQSADDEVLNGIAKAHWGLVFTGKRWRYLFRIGLEEL
jgi:glutamine cyclotransferase